MHKFSKRMIDKLFKMFCLKPCTLRNIFPNEIIDFGNGLRLFKQSEWIVSFNFTCEILLNISCNKSTWGLCIDIEQSAFNFQSSLAKGVGWHSYWYHPKQTVFNKYNVSIKKKSIHRHSSRNGDLIVGRLCVCVDVCFLHKTWEVTSKIKFQKLKQGVRFSIIIYTSIAKENILQIFFINTYIQCRIRWVNDLKIIFSSLFLYMYM